MVVAKAQLSFPCICINLVTAILLSFLLRYRHRCHCTCLHNCHLNGFQNDYTMIWHRKMLLCVHQSTETEQWGITVTVSTKGNIWLHLTFPYYLAKQNPNALPNWGKTQKMNLYYSVLLRYMQTDHLWLPKQYQWRYQQEKVPKPIQRWRKLESTETSVTKHAVPC